MLFFGITATVLAGLGLHAVLAYSLAWRRRDIGIRISLGAGIRHIALTVGGRITAAGVSGLIGGLVISVLALRLTRHLLFDVRPLDPASLVLSSCIMTACIALANVTPVWSAFRTDVTAALHEE